MTNPLLVVVGACTSTSARILCVFPQGAATHARIHWRAGGASGTAESALVPAPPFGRAVVDLAGLPAGAPVEYAVVGAGGAAGDPGADEAFAGDVRRFRTLPEGRPLRIAFVSCNGVRKNTDEELILWKKLADRVAEGAVDLVIHGGDQIYADRLWEAHLDDGEPALDADAEAKLVADYRELYRKAWSRPYVSRVLASCANLMAWDDHDIFDGYGSHDDDDGPSQQTFFRAARQAYDEFQVSHGPAPLHGETFLRAFVHDGVGIVLLDTRSRRLWTEQRVLGDAQIAALKTWGDEHARGLRRLYVVSSIPMLHAKVSGALALLRIKPGTESAEDDLRDSWLAPNNVTECGRLAKWLFSTQTAEDGPQVTVLGGDVHVASLAEFRSRLPQHASRSKVTPRIFQITSSGIGSAPPGGILTAIMELASRDTVPLGTSDIEGRLMQINGARTLFLGRRNFVLLNLEDDDPDRTWNRHGNLRADYYIDRRTRCDTLTQVLNGPGEQ